MPKAILHIGTMKTGTTSIQATLAGNSDVLASHGYSYMGPPMRHSTVLAPALAALPDRSHHLIISDEGLWHFTDSKRSDTAELAKLLKSYDVTVLIYLRRPDSFLNSWFQQGLKSGTGALTMTKFLASSFVHSGLQFQRLIKRYETLFGPESIRLRAYEKTQLAQGDAVVDFLQTVGLPLEDFTIPERANTTPDTDSLLLRSLFQQDAPRSPRQTTQLNMIADHMARQGYKGRHYSLLSPEETQNIVSTYRPVFRNLQDKYGGGASPEFFESWPDPSKINTSKLELRWTQEAMLEKAPHKTTTIAVIPPPLSPIQH